MACNLEIISQTRKIQTQHKKQTQLIEEKKKNTTNHQKPKRKHQACYTHVYKLTYTHAHQRKQETKSLIYDMRRTGNLSRWQIPSAWSWILSSGIRSI